jgi:O-antigen biosynthesis protein
MKYDFEVNISSDSTHSLILRRVSKSSRVLEFGPATGYMTKYMQQSLGCAVTGVELDPESAERAKEYCEEMIVADIDSLSWVEQLKGKSFDHILFADVLEHLRNPAEALQYASSFLRPNGTIITSIPNIAHNAVIMELLQGKFKYRPLGLLDDTHIRFFTKNSIIALLESLELCPVDWVATCVTPEQSEFEQDYSLFPQSIIDQLQSRPDGNAYQYVTVSKRKEDVTADEQQRAFAEIRDYHPANRYLQISWKQAEGPVEAEFVKVPLKYGNEFHQYDISIPNVDSGILKLSPGNLHGFLRIRSIVVRQVNDDGSEGEDIISLNSLQGFSDLLPGSGTLFLSNNKNKNIVISNSHPEFFLGPIQRTKANESLLLSMVISISQEVPVDFVLDLEQKLIEKSERISALENSSSWRITGVITVHK